ncbi:hypothetical protein Syun_017139 [Stephania yunnanensis]|uniref:Uncharacterized protein n=1 Tax=Stephania yunnanensis TaxID=152371 RepID=A0AAP0J8Q3_9MAGN
MERSGDLGSRFHLKRNRDPRSRFLLNITLNSSFLQLPGLNKLHSSYPSTEPEVTTPDWLHWCRSSLHLQLQIRTATHPQLNLCIQLCKINMFGDFRLFILLVFM